MAYYIIEIDEPAIGQEVTPKRITTCAECKHAKIETHKGDDELVCWHHHPGYVTQPDGYCHRAVMRDAYAPIQ